LEAGSVMPPAAASFSKWLWLFDLFYFHTSFSIDCSIAMKSKTKSQPTEWEKYLQMTYQIKG